MKYFILTDLEGPAGVDSFSMTRSTDDEVKRTAMEQLGREVNACIEGIRTVDADAMVDVLDGHGSGGLFPDSIVDGNYLRLQGHFFGYADYDAQLFVGQHAMAGTYNAPLRHTYSSRHIAYYRLNDVFIGEFGCRALAAGKQGCPTIMLAGDDKAALEAKMFIPEIEVAVTKNGRGIEAADSLSHDAACDEVRSAATRAVERLGEIPPFVGIDPPYRLEIRYLSKLGDTIRDDATRVDDYTIAIETDDLTQLPI